MGYVGNTRSRYDFPSIESNTHPVTVKYAHYHEIKKKMVPDEVKS